MKKKKGKSSEKKEKEETWTHEISNKKRKYTTNMTDEEWAKQLQEELNGDEELARKLQVISMTEDTILSKLLII